VPTKPRFVFDTSAIISAALLKRSVSRKAFDKALDEGELLVSAETIDELNQVLGRADFAKYVTEDERMEFLSEMNLAKDQGRKWAKLESSSGIRLRLN